MPKTVQKTLTFPLAGVSRRRGYREQERPYAAPWAINVRGVGPLESRDRGGSRAGLTKANSNDFGTKIAALLPITSIDASGDRHRDLVVIADGAFSYLRGSAVSTINATLDWPDGEVMLWEDGEEVVFDASVATSNPLTDSGAYHSAERAGKLYIADSVVREYDPNTGVVGELEATAGTMPTSQPLICFYRDRLVLAGENHIWQASRTSVITDFNLGAEMTDVNRAVAGQLEHAGAIGADIKALIPHKDQYLVFACSNSIWVLRGDPATGRMSSVSEEIGIIAPEAWAKTSDGLLAFLSNDGIYIWGAGDGERPTRFSEERLPDQLRNIDTTTNTIVMGYDPIARGFHLYITPETGSGTHWFLDIDNRALWPVVLYEEHQPLAVARVESDALGELVLGCKDGYLRKFSASASTDDGVPIESHVLLGPFRIAGDDVQDALLAEIHGVMADNDKYVKWRIVTGNSAEAVADDAVSGINAVLEDDEETATSVTSATGVWESLRNKVQRPRTRGAWVIVWLEGEGLWSYEAVAVVARQLGRLR